MNTKLLALLAVTGAFSANTMANETVSVSGSTSVTDVMEVLAETYHKANPAVFIEVQGTGSSAGVKAAKNNTSMLGMSSRALKDSEKEAALNETTIAKDGIAVAINPKNSVQNLTKDQIAAIYRGEVKNWSEVGGENQPVVVVTRDTASGTRGAFEDIMGLKRKINGKSVSAISPMAQVGHGNGAVKTTVANNTFAIGYISLGSVDQSVKAVQVNGVDATAANVSNGTYEIARPFLVLHKDANTSEAAKKFVEWMVSPAGQKIVTEQGYIAAN